MNSPRHFHVTVPVPRDGDCAIRDLFDILSTKWAPLILIVLADGPRRFNALQRSFEGISHRMLTTTLTMLVRDGLVSRTVEPSVPPKVEYALTELGESILGPLEALDRWAHEARERVIAARMAYDSDTADRTRRSARLTAPPYRKVAYAPRA